MIEVMEPEDALLRRFVDSIYIFGKAEESLEFTAFPGVNTPVGLFRNAKLSLASGTIGIESSDSPDYCAVACNLFSRTIHLRYRQLVDEIAINFKPAGFRSFTQSKLQDGTTTDIEAWNALLPALFTEVFATTDPALRLAAIEKFLLARYEPLAEECILLETIALLNDTAQHYKMTEIATMLGIHYKRLYRLFSENVGCSMAHYRNLVKFRASVFSKVNSGEKTRLVDICYDHGYTDQSYFIRQFRELTGEKPARFFRDVTAFGNDKIVFRME